MLNAPYWQIDGDGVDPASFFGALASLFPKDASLFVEGADIDRRVHACYLQHAEPGPYLPEAGTIRPISRKLRCALSPALCGELARLSEQAAEPEVADHLHVFINGEHVLCWFDAFAHDLWLSSQVPEEAVRALASRLGRPYEIVKQPN